MLPTAGHAGASRLHRSLTSTDQPRLPQATPNFHTEYSALSRWLQKAAAGNRGRMWRIHLKKNQFKSSVMGIVQCCLLMSFAQNYVNQEPSCDVCLKERDLHQGRNPTAFTSPLWVTRRCPSSWAFAHIWPRTSRNCTQQGKSRERRAAFEINPTVQIPSLCGKYYDPAFASRYMHWREDGVGCEYVCQGSVFSCVYLAKWRSQNYKEGSNLGLQNLCSSVAMGLSGQ